MELKCFQDKRLRQSTSIIDFIEEIPIHFVELTHDNQEISIKVLYYYRNIFFPTFLGADCRHYLGQCHDKVAHLILCINQCY